MKEKLEYFIKLKLKNPIKEEIEQILEVFSQIEYKKGEFFKRQDQVCERIGFIIEGSTQHYGIKNNGNKVTGRISLKNDFVTDLLSIRTKGFTPITIVCSEPTTLLVAPISKIQHLFETNLTLNRLMREYMAESIVEISKLYILFLTGTAKERYQFIIDKNPNLLKKVPLRIIASMIGITSTQLSRIRKKKGAND